LKSIETQLIVESQRNKGRTSPGKSSLNVYVGKAANLGRVAQSIVSLQQGNMKTESTIKAGSSPNYAFKHTFEVEDEFQPLVVNLLNCQTGQPVIDKVLNVQDFIQNKEAFKLSANEEDETAPELEMKCDYAVDAMRMLTERKGIIKQEMFNDALMVRQVQKFIEQLVKPFPFLQVVAE
jgi:hypothetical protein